MPVAAWRTVEDGAGPEVFSAVVCEGMRAGLTHDLVLVLDDVHEIGAAGAAARLIESLCLQAPESLHVVLASRAAPPFPSREPAPPRRAAGAGRRRARVHASRRSPNCSSAAVSSRAWPGACTRRRAAGRSRSRSRSRRCGGRPAGAARERALAALRRPEAGCSHTSRARCSPASRPGCASCCGASRRSSSTPAALCEELGAPGTADALAGLLRRGLAVRSDDGSLSLHALIRDFVLDSWPLDGAEERDLRRRAAAWLSRHGAHVDALPHLAAAGDVARAGTRALAPRRRDRRARRRTTRPRGGGRAWSRVP